MLHSVDYAKSPSATFFHLLFYILLRQNFELNKSEQKPKNHEL